MKDLVREKEEEIVSEHPGLGNLLRDIVMATIVVYGSFIEIKLLWRKENLCVQHFTRDGKETDNATDNDIDIVVVIVAI